MHVRPLAFGPEHLEKVVLPKTASMPPQPQEGAKTYSSINTTDINTLNPHIKRFSFYIYTSICMCIKIYSMHQTQKNVVALCCEDIN